MIELPKREKYIDIWAWEPLIYTTIFAGINIIIDDTENVRSGKIIPLESNPVWEIPE